MISTLFKKIIQNKTVLGTLLFLLLGIFTRFAFIDNPKEVVFDEFHFFHFVSEYEEGEYFFDIHPPLGKLVLWANAQMYGLPEFIHENQENKLTKETLELEQKNLKKQVVLLEKNEKSAQKIQKLAELKTQYENNKSKIEYLSTHIGGLSSIGIGKEYSETLNITGIRSVPAFFGAALVALMFYFAYFLTSSYAISTLIGMLTLFSPAFLVQSQYVLMDSILMFFIVLGGLFSLKYYKNPSWKNWIIVISTSAIVISIKWTGATLIGLSGIIWLVIIFQSKISFGKWISQFFAFWIFVPAFYMGTFALHFALLPNSGEGDVFHTPEFRANLENTSENINNKIIPKTFFLNTKYHPPLVTTEPLDFFLQKKINPYFDPLISEPQDYQKNEYILNWENWLFYGKFIELNRQMGERSAAIRDEHPFASRPSDWIHGKKSIYLWNKEGSAENLREPKGVIPEFWNNYIGGNFTKPNNFQGRYVQQLHLFTNSTLWSILPYSTLFLILLLFIFKIIKYFQKNEILEKKFNNYYMSYQIFIIIMILMNIVPFLLVERPQFLYHAFEGVLFGILGLGMALNSLYLFSDYVSKKYISNILWGITMFVTILLIIFFIIELPLIYGFPFHDSMAHTMFQLF
ncbi:TPA: phospholipid carrier-dependent glycosyltransferase [Candidatus Gracilibacteria bacterium]|nr:phospholipid carrier-dependent glycosyltransferase [Candidatus Gracilibacteria bacterium]HIQ57651.1 phospholipid carrier-dependent glycosyltransferase [Candidatus Gracilibacteria bacterium]